MERKHFLKHILTTSTFIAMDGFSAMVGAMSNINENAKNPAEYASFAAMHLNITNLEKSTAFWTKLVGMKLRKASKDMAEFGTEAQTLVVLHQTAKTKFKKGYSGLYHFAIHAPNVSEFASMIHRLNVNKYPYSPIDHTMSKSIYLDDPDGINVEFTLETPERFKRVVTQGGLGIEDSDGVIRSASVPLNIDEVLSHLKDDNVDRVISNNTYLGHVHLYATSVEDSNAFYKKIGFEQFNYLPQFKYADLGAGGTYKHRIVMNSWHGDNRPLAPRESAGMRHFQITFHTREKLEQALSDTSSYQEKDGGFWFQDPTGNKILLTSA